MTKTIQQQSPLATNPEIRGQNFDFIFNINCLHRFVLEEYLPNVHKIWIRDTEVSEPKYSTKPPSH